MYPRVGVRRACASTTASETTTWGDGRGPRGGRAEAQGSRCVRQPTDQDHLTLLCLQVTHPRNWGRVAPPLTGQLSTQVGEGFADRRARRFARRNADTSAVEHSALARESMGTTRQMFGAVVVYVLLLLYIVLVGYLTCIVIAADSPTDVDPVGNAELVVMTVGALVSALVVAQLATTPTGAAAGTELIDATRKVRSTLVILYLVGWMLAGLAALAVGVIWRPEFNATLGDIGTAWLGTAVAAGYAYFSLSPPTDDQPTP